MTNLYYRLSFDNSIWSVDEVGFVAETAPEAIVTEIPDLAELRKCLRFYKFGLGELAGPEDRTAEIKAELDALDAKYLTPRVLANLARGDEYALLRLAGHEEKAAHIREELTRLSEVTR